MLYNIPVSKLSSKSVDSMSIDEGCPESFGGGSWMKKLGREGTCTGPSSLTCGTTYMHDCITSTAMHRWESYAKTEY